MKNSVRAPWPLLSLALFLFASLSGCAKKQDVTLEEYKRVTEGMSYAQVVEIVGKEGVQNGTSTPGPAATEAERAFTLSERFYVWSNEDNSNMVCVFASDKLIAKDQTGLQ